MSAARGSGPGAHRARCAPVFACMLAFGLLPMAMARHADAREPHAAAGPMATYVTHAGDTLYDVAERYLQDPADWAQLARINHVSAPRRLQPGLTLRLPVALLREESLSAQVIATSGPASHAFRNGPALPLIVGSSLVEGDQVQTGHEGFATLELPDGSHLVMPPDSALDLGALRQTVLTGATDRVVDLHRGEVDSEVTHATKKDDRFQIRSPSVVAGVRGTRFRVSYDAGGATAVEVIDGAVGVDPASATRAAPAPGTPLQASAQLVAARHGSLTRAGGAIGSPVALLDAPDLLHPSKVQDDAEVAFDVAPVAGAAGYRVQIGRDAGLLDMIRDLRSATPHIAAGPLDDGTYFVRVSAIDANGLQGMPGTYAFERRPLALGTSAGRLAGSRDYAFRWFVDRRHAAGTRFRFVLSATADLAAPLVDRTDIDRGEAIVSDLPPGDYYWTVIAEQFQNGRYYAKASPVQSFKLSR